VVERLMWMLGLGADIAIPVSVNCLGCPLEPWTYVEASCGMPSYDLINRWVDLELWLSGHWTEKVPSLQLPYALAYIDWDVYLPALEILGEPAEPTDPGIPGWAWPELSEMEWPQNQSVERAALTILAALVSHADNKAINQGFNCVLNGSATGSPLHNCDPYLFIHDVGCTLGFGWDVLAGDMWPNALDNTKWLPVFSTSDLPSS
jgi:hypothetical protein